MTPMQVLKKLFKDHFFYHDGGWEWSYGEDDILSEIDPALAKEIDRLLVLGEDEKPV